MNGAVPLKLTETKASRIVTVPNEALGRCLRRFDCHASISDRQELRNSAAKTRSGTAYFTLRRLSNGRTRNVEAAKKRTVWRRFRRRYPRTRVGAPSNNMIQPTGLNITDN